VKILSKFLQVFSALAFAWVLFIPLIVNPHKGFIDKSGDHWYGYDVVFLSPMVVIITTILPIAFCMAAIAPFLAKPSKSWITWSVVTWLLSLIVGWFIYMGNRRDLMPGFTFFIGILLLWPWPTAWLYILTRDDPPPPRPPTLRR